MEDRALFIGGVAVECYAPYRRTHDIDLVIRERDFPALRSALQAMGFSHSRPPHLVEHAFKAREAGEVDVYTQSVGGIDVDEALFQRGRELAFGGVRVHAASMEDLIGLKLNAGREMDLSDIALLFHEKGDEIDARLLEGLAGRDSLRRVAPSIPELLPEEYGWQARQRLKAWLREKEWLVPVRKTPHRARR